MAEFVIDNSVVMVWCFEEEKSPYALAVLDELQSGKAHAPQIWPLEVGNVLLVAERRKRISANHSMRFMELLKALPITIERETGIRNWSELVGLARNQNLSTYDASYLDLAIRLGLPLATNDQALIRASKNMGVPVFKKSN